MVVGEVGGDGVHPEGAEAGGAGAGDGGTGGWRAIVLEDVVAVVFGFDVGAVAEFDLAEVGGADGGFGAEAGLCDGGEEDDDEEGDDGDDDEEFDESECARGRSCGFHGGVLNLLVHGGDMGDASGCYE